MHSQTKIINNLTQIIMKKFAYICAILLTSMVCGAQESNKCSCESVNYIDGQKSENWNNRLDFFNLVKPIDVQQYRTLFLLPIDCSNTQWADPSHKTACAAAIEEYSELFIEGMQETFHNLEVYPAAKDEDISLNKLSLGLCIRIDEFNPAARAMRASVTIFDMTNNEICDFRHKYSTDHNTPKEAALDALDHITNDVSYVLTSIVKGAGRAAAEAERAAREAEKAARRKK